MAVPEALQEISTKVEHELQSTPLACSSLTRLSGGTANFVFCGQLVQPLDDGTHKVIIKHGEDYVALQPDFKIPTTRCRYEAECLKAVDKLSSTNSACSIRTPKLFHFNAETNTQIQEYLPDSLDLKTYSLKHLASPTPGSLKPRCHAIGNGLGSWLRSFHEWAAQPQQAEFRQTIRLNKQMQAIKLHVNYTNMPQAAATKEPSLSDDVKNILKEVAAMAEAELQDESELQIVHGDFWTGNILLPNVPLGNDDDTQMPMFVVDWEVCQLGIPASDLGQMIAELYELFLFKDIEAGLWMAEGLVAAYGIRSEAFAFRVLIHVGSHFLCWGNAPGWGSAEKYQEVFRHGIELITKAWSRDSEWCRNQPLAFLFANVSN